MKCTKMQGGGNDFVFVDYQDALDMNLSELTKKLCDRHYGVGGDGAIFVKQSPLEFIYYNSDGSYSSFCGNGMRCFAKYCKKRGIVKSNEFDVRCKDWIVHCVISGDEVTVQIPEVTEEKMQDGTEIIVVCGSRHKVEMIDNLDNTEIVQSDEYNLNIVEWVSKNEIRIKTVERGAGLTLACGSGSYASAYKMYKNKKCSEKILVKNPGGMVKINVEKQEMTGPAEEIFECEIQ